MKKIANALVCFTLLGAAAAQAQGLSVGGSLASSRWKGDDIGGVHRQVIHRRQALRRLHRSRRTSASRPAMRTWASSRAPRAASRPTASTPMRSARCRWATAFGARPCRPVQRQARQQPGRRRARHQLQGRRGRAVRLRQAARHPRRVGALPLRRARHEVERRHGLGGPELQVLRIRRGAGCDTHARAGHGHHLPARILQVLRSSSRPSTCTRPSATIALAAPPLPARPVALSKASRVMNSPRSANSI